MTGSSFITSYKVIALQPHDVSIVQTDLILYEKHDPGKIHGHSTALPRGSDEAELKGAGQWMVKFDPTPTWLST